MASAPRRSESLSIRPELLVAFLLVISTLAVYSRTRNHDFISYDDTAYVTQNPEVLKGLTIESTRWALTATEATNWHPLTWWSHMLDVQLYGLNSGNHHLTNVLIHSANGLLLFFFLLWTTGALWRSGLVAMLFALHPLHVESVAWIAERKDVLSSFFWMLSMLTYTWYAKRPKVSRYLTVLCCFSMGLLAKPMLVPLPFVLLLLDVWPLRRARIHLFGKKISGGNVDLYRLVLEKIPFFLISTISCIITYWVQLNGGAVAPHHLYPLDVRLANALVSYAHYLIKTIWPGNLCVLYPHPGMPPLWQTSGAVLILTLVTALAVRKAVHHPWLIMGWLWFLGTLVPVIGIVQVGAQAMADRYTYMPLIGIFIIIAWGIPGRMLEHSRGKTLVITGCLASLLLLSLLSWRQTGYWQNSQILYRHALAATTDNHVIHYNLGVVLSEQGRIDEAIDHYRQTLIIRPDYKKAHNNLGFALAEKGRFDAAIRHYTRALQIDPSTDVVYNNLGNAYLMRGQLDHALTHYRKALERNQRYATAHNNLGLALLRKGSIETAISHFEASLRTDPANRAPRGSLTLANAFQEKIGAAADSVTKSIDFNPNSSNLDFQLHEVSRRKAVLWEIIDQYLDALSFQPEFNPGDLNINNLPRVRAATRAYEGALWRFHKAVEIDPGNAAACYHLACIYARRGDAEKSLFWFQKIGKIGMLDLPSIEKDKDLETVRPTRAYRDVIETLKRSSIHSDLQN